MTRAFVCSKLVKDLIPLDGEVNDLTYQKYKSKGDAYIRGLCKKFHEQADSLKSQGGGSGDMLREASDVFTFLSEMNVLIGYLSEKIAPGGDQENQTMAAF